MTTLNTAKIAVALNIGGGSETYPGYFVIGSGSGTVLPTQTSLFNPLDIQAFTSRNTSTPYKVTFTGDWNSVEMSGLRLSEFGLVGNSGTGFTGSLWTKNVTPSIIFDGTNELRIEETLEVF